MSTPRTLIGLAIGSGFEAADAVVVRLRGVGWGIAAEVAAAARVPLPPEARLAGRGLLRSPDRPPTDFAKALGEALVRAANRAAGSELRSSLAVGYLDPLSGAADHSPTVTDWVAEWTGLTVAAGFRGADEAAGGSGHLLGAAADYLLFTHPEEHRLLVHLGSRTTAVFLPAGGKPSDVTGFVAGPGTRLLDDLTSLGTRGREQYDAGGTKAVQGKCLDALLGRWLGSPVSLSDAFLAEAFHDTRAANGSLHDLLCTATRFVARRLRAECERRLGERPAAARVLVSGGGVRNGFLWKLVGEQFPDCAVERLDAVGVPSSSRSAAAAALLAALTMDGVTANLPLLTGAVGGRLLGRFTPGDPRNWAACTAWMAAHLVDHTLLTRAA